MKNNKFDFLLREVLGLLAVSMFLFGCGRESSPEGRITIKIETLQQQLDSLNAHNKAILDSLGHIRKELQELKEAKR